MITVGMPFASRCRAIRLTVWWQTGQVGTSSAASAPLSRTSGESGRRVDVDGRHLAAVGGHAAEARRESAEAPGRDRFAQPCEGSQVLGSSAVVCTRS